MKPKAQPRKRALIVKFGAIGDVIMAIPAAHALHQQGFDIDWACGRAVQPLLECYSWINLIPADDKAILTGTIWQKVRGIAALWKKIGLRQYDLSVTLYYDFRYKLVTFPLRAKRKRMLSQSSRSSVLLPGRHHTDEYTRVLLGSEDGCHDTSTSPVRPDRLPPSPLSVKQARYRVALVPGAAKHLIREQASGRLPEQVLRRWPVEAYVALAQYLIDRAWEVVLLGGPEDVWVRPYFEHLNVTDCMGKLTLPEFVTACDASDVVITHDTGPLHLAGLSTTCLIGIFGPTDPATRVPRRPYAMGIWGGQGFACRPCYDGRDFAPCRHNRCMEQVSPELVLHELDQLLAARSASKPSPWRVVFPDVSTQAATNPEFISLTTQK